MALIPVRAAYAAIGFGTTPVWTAKEAGLFAEEGLDVQLDLIRGSTRVVQALLADEIQFANIASPAAVEANLGGADLVYVTGGVNWLVQTLIVQPEIVRGEQLRGKTLGVGEPGNIEDRLIHSILAEYGLRLGDDVVAQRIRNQPDTLERLERREIDAGLFSPPYQFEATTRGFRVLYDALSRRMDFQLGGIVTRRSFIDAHPDITEAFVRGYVRGVHAARTRPDFVRDILRKYSHIENDEVAALTYDVVTQIFQPRPYPTQKGVQAVVELLKESDPRARTADPNGMTDLRWVRALDTSGYVEQLYA